MYCARPCGPALSSSHIAAPLSGPLPSTSQPPVIYPAFGILQQRPPRNPVLGRCPRVSPRSFPLIRPTLSPRQGHMGVTPFRPGLLVNENRPQSVRHTMKHPPFISPVRCRAVRPGSLAMMNNPGGQPVAHFSSRTEPAKHSPRSVRCTTPLHRPSVSLLSIPSDSSSNFHHNNIQGEPWRALLGGRADNNILLESNNSCNNCRATNNYINSPACSSESSNTNFGIPPFMNAVGGTVTHAVTIPHQSIAATMTPAAGICPSAVCQSIITNSLTPDPEAEGIATNRKGKPKLSTNHNAKSRKYT
eukprot:Filipodium_phascolosomae@DN6725_c0_g1_i1.p1